MASSQSFEHDNPYRSPHAVPGSKSGQHFGILVDSRWLYRCVHLPEPINALVVYSGWGMGYETVYVNGQVASQKSGPLWFVPRFDFQIPVGGASLNASIEVKIGLTLRLSRFVMRIDDKVVYAEP